MNKQELIANHAQMAWQALYATLGLNGIEYGVDYRGVDVNNSVMLLTFSLSMVNTSKWDKFRAMTEAFSQAMDLDEEHKVRVGYNGLDYRIEVPKPPEYHDVVNIRDVFKESTGLKVSFGLSAYNNKPNLVDFSTNRSGHMLVSGQTRCGKTNILKLIIMSMMYKTSPDNVRIAVIDTIKAKEKYSVLKNSSHLATDVLNTGPKAIAFLEWCVNTIERLEGRKYGKKIIIVIDEVFLLVENNKVSKLLRYIASAGAEVGFHIIAATQYTRVDEIGGKQFKGNLTTRVAGRVDDHHSSLNATGKSGAGAEHLMETGDFLVVDAKGINRVAVPYVDDKLFNKIPRGLTPLMSLNWNEEETDEVMAVPKAPNISACFGKIDPRLLKLAVDGRNKRTGRPFGADVIRHASKVLEKRGIGQAIGQGTANEYVTFAKRYRGS